MIVEVMWTLATILLLMNVENAFPSDEVTYD